jgi:hypothetical protein
MKKETNTKYTVKVSELLSSLGIKGVVVSCGFNTKLKNKSKNERELTIIVKTNKK